MNWFLLAQQSSGDSGIPIFMIAIYLAVIVIVVVAQWVVFTKAGQPGWASIIPIYNFVVLLEIVNRPLWWIILLFIPCVNIVIAIMVVMDLATSFGKGGGFAAGLIFLPFIFYPILAFGDATYRRIPR